jgi:hypothetical protein
MVKFICIIYIITRVWGSHIIKIQEVNAYLGILMQPAKMYPSKKILEPESLRKNWAAKWWSLDGKRVLN